VKFCFLSRIKILNKLTWTKAFLAAAVCWTVLAPIAARLLIVRVPIEKADAIVVLGGSAAYSERVDEAQLLYRGGVAPLILLTNDDGKAGWNEEEKRNPYFFELARWRLLRQGVPESSIRVLTPTVKGTMGEAEAIVDAALRENMSSLVIVTSPYHSRRALWTYRFVERTKGKNLDLGLEPAMNWTQSPRWYLWWVSPSGWLSIPSEYLKIAYYWARY
jgi:uncharacterized SAM-binding protein YcdF (DUF218 family)